MLAGDCHHQEWVGSVGGDASQPRRGNDTYDKWLDEWVEIEAL